MTPILEVRDLRKWFPAAPGSFRRTGGSVRAVDGVDLDLARAEILALVGESGSGKTTLGRSVLRLIEPTEGSVRFRGEDLLGLSPSLLRERRRHLQMIFQDPFTSLDPRMRVGDAVYEPLRIHGLVPRKGPAGRMGELLEEVGLSADLAQRFPHQLSGGERQRVGIARALATSPSLVIADEPVSSLDVSVRAQVVNLLLDLQRRRGLALLFIAHDLSLAARIADRIAVIYLGKFVEEAPAAALLAAPQHPYTSALLSAVPSLDPASAANRIRLSGEPPNPASPPTGCAFHPRCPISGELCVREPPVYREVSPGHRVACHFPGELRKQAPSPAGGTFPAG